MKKYVKADTDISDDGAKEAAKTVMDLAVQDGYLYWKQTYFKKFNISEEKKNTDFSKNDIDLINHYIRILDNKLEDYIEDIEL